MEHLNPRRITKDYSYQNTDPQFHISTCHIVIYRIYETKELFEISTGKLVLHYEKISDFFEIVYRSSYLQSITKSYSNNIV